MAKTSKPEVGTAETNHIVTQEMRDKLRAPLPPEAITPHPTKPYLSSIKAIYVTERLNDVFGVGAHQIRSSLVERGENGTVVTKTELTIPAYNIHLECFGGNDNGGDNSKNFDLGDAFKGSVTDSLTKICSWLEIGIDVFKGKNKAKVELKKETPKTDAPKAPQKTDTPKTQKPILNKQNKQWEPTVEKVKAGTPIETVKSFFEISPEDEAELLTHVPK